MRDKPHLIRVFDSDSGKMQTIRADDLGQEPSAQRRDPLNYADAVLAKEAYRRFGCRFPAYPTQSMFIKALERERNPSREIALYFAMADAFERIVLEQSPTEQTCWQIAQILMHTSIFTVDIAAIVGVPEELVQSTQRYYFGEPPTDDLCVVAGKTDALSPAAHHAAMMRMSRPLASLGHPDTGKAMTEKAKRATFIVGVNTERGKHTCSFFYRPTVYSDERLVLSEPETVIFQLDFRTYQLEALCRAVEDLRGSCCYGQKQ